MDLGHERDVPVGQTLDQVELPQRAVPVERAGEDALDLLGQLGVGARGRERQLAHVVSDVEARILDPVGPIEPEGHRVQLVLHERQEVQALVDGGAEVLERELAAGTVGGVEDREPRDVPVGRRALDRQELRVQAAQLLHRALLRMRTASPCGPVLVIEQEIGRACVRERPGRAAHGSGAWRAWSDWLAGERTGVGSRP